MYFIYIITLEYNAIIRMYVCLCMYVYQYMNATLKIFKIRCSRPWPSRAEKMRLVIECCYCFVLLLSNSWPWSRLQVTNIQAERLNSNYLLEGLVENLMWLVPNNVYNFIIFWEKIMCFFKNLFSSRWKIF